jgi:hypothetical protein
MQHGLDHQLVLRLLLKVLDHSELLQGLLLKVLVLVDRELLLSLLLELRIDENFFFLLVWREYRRATFDFLLFTKLQGLLLGELQGIGQGSMAVVEHVEILTDNR